MWFMEETSLNSELKKNIVTGRLTGEFCGLTLRNGSVLWPPSAGRVCSKKCEIKFRASMSVLLFSDLWPHCLGLFWPAMFSLKVRAFAYYLWRDPGLLTQFCEHNITSVVPIRNIWAIWQLTIHYPLKVSDVWKYYLLFLSFESRGVWESDRGQLAFQGYFCLSTLWRGCG